MIKPLERSELPRPGVVVLVIVGTVAGALTVAGGVWLDSLAQTEGMRTGLMVTSRVAEVFALLVGGATVLIGLAYLVCCRFVAGRLKTGAITGAVLALVALLGTAVAVPLAASAGSENTTPAVTSAVAVAQGS